MIMYDREEITFTKLNSTNVVCSHLDEAVPSHFEAAVLSYFDVAAC